MEGVETYTRCETYESEYDVTNKWEGVMDWWLEKAYTKYCSLKSLEGSNSLIKSRMESPGISMEKKIKTKKKENEVTIFFSFFFPFRTKILTTHNSSSFLTQ